MSSQFSQGYINSKSALVWVMAHRTDDKPLHETKIILLLTDEYMHQRASMS